MGVHQVWGLESTEARIAAMVSVAKPAMSRLSVVPSSTVNASSVPTYVEQRQAGSELWCGTESEQHGEGEQRAHL